MQVVNILIKEINKTVIILDRNILVNIVELQHHGGGLVFDLTNYKWDWSMCENWFLVKQRVH